MSMLENKNSEAGFREQFELEYQKKRKEEEERKRKEEAEKKRKEEEERKRPESIAKHKKNIAPLGSDSKELRAYVKAHFDKERKLSNCRGEKTYCSAKEGAHPDCP